MTDTATAGTGPADFLLRTANDESLTANAALEQLDQAAADASLAEVAARAIEALTGELRALRHTLAATIAPHQDADAEPVWARLELFGHTTVHGQVREVTRFGRRFLELTQPELTVHPGTTNERALAATSKLYSPSALYAFQEITEGDALIGIRRSHGIYLTEDTAVEDPSF